MGLINDIVTKLFYCASIFIFFHTFLEYAKLTARRALVYFPIGFILCAIVIYDRLSADNVIIILAMYLSFLIFSGRIFEKLCLGLIAQSVWWGFQLLNVLLFDHVIFIITRSPNGKEFLLDLLSMVMLVLGIYILGKKVACDADTARKSACSNWYQIGMIFLALEGDILFFIASHIYDGKLQIYVGNRLFSVLICIGGIYMLCFALLLSAIGAKEYYHRANKSLQEQLKSQFAYYQKLEQIAKETRAIKHDLKNHFIVLKGLAEKKDIVRMDAYIGELLDSFEKVHKVICTGNTIVDSILNEKIERARSKGIEINVDVGIPQDILISEMDLCIMLANGLDNAIEACDKIKPENVRQITVYGRYEKGFLSFIIKNTKTKSVYIINNKIVSDKLDKLNHGYGLQNINNSVKRNQGKMKIECQDDFFILYLDIPCGLRNKAT